MSENIKILSAKIRRLVVALEQVQSLDSLAWLQKGYQPLLNRVVSSPERPVCLLLTNHGDASRAQARCAY